MRTTLCVFSFIFLLLVCEHSNGRSENEFELPLYDGWAKESINIPLSFAPGIELSGLEELRFSPGMFVENDPQYWSYLFVWWVEENQVIPELLLEKYLEKYFFGLAKEIAKHKKSEPSGVTYKVSLESDEEGAIVGQSLLVEKDIHSEIPSLNIKINQILCKPQGRLAVIFELTPKQFSHSNWLALSKLKTEFRCGV